MCDRADPDRQDESDSRKNFGWVRGTGRFSDGSRNIRALGKFCGIRCPNSLDGLWLLNHNLFLPRAFGRLLVYEDRVVYKCLLRKTRVLRFEECEYIGVENYDKLNRGLPVVRGDETSFIYFSKKPFPQKYVGKVTTLKNSKDFIKITYTDKLAKALIDILPAEKDNLLRSFYAKMQAADRELNANKKSKKSKKK